MSTIETIRSKLIKAKEEAQDVFFEREDFIELVYNCLAGSLPNKKGRPGRRLNVSIVGEPGVAKSAILRFILGGIEGAFFGAYQIHRQTKLEELFGNLKLTSLKRDIYEYKWQGRAPDQHVILLDEGWNGSSALLQALHLLMNEGKFYSGEEELDAKTVFTAIAANVIPEDNLDAMYDRFVARFHVKRISEMGSFIRMLEKNDYDKQKPESIITFEELTQVQEHVEKVEIPESVFEKTYQIRQDGLTEGLRLTDRRIKLALALVKAQAWFNGHKVAEDEDLEVYEHVLWCDPKESVKARDVVLEVANPLGKQIETLIDAAFEARDQALGCKESERKKKLIQEANAKMASAVKEAGDIIKLMKKANKLTGKYEHRLTRLQMAQSKFMLEVHGVQRKKKSK